MGQYKWLVGFAGLFLVHALACTTNASAEYIQFTFTGAVTEIVGAPWPDAQLGDPIEIQYIVDSNAEDQILGSDWGRYDFLVFSFSLNNVAMSTSDGYVDMNYDPYFEDLYELHFNFGNGIDGLIYIWGTDMLFSDALPLDVDWTQYSSWHLGSISSSIPGYIDYQFTNYEYAIVPSAPSFIVLLFSSFCRRKRL